MPTVGLRDTELGSKSLCRFLLRRMASLMAPSSLFRASRRLTRSCLLSLQVLVDQRIILARNHIRMEDDRRQFGLLGQQAIFEGAQAQVTLADAFKIGARLPVVQLDQQIPRLDFLAFAHHHLFDQAAGEVLDGLPFGVDHRPRPARAPPHPAGQRLPTAGTRPVPPEGAWRRAAPSG